MGKGEDRRKVEIVTLWSDDLERAGRDGCEH